jgi:HEPN domain-containing protein
MNDRINSFAKDYILRAKERLTNASSALRRKSYPEVIRYSQEATELSLKASLRIIGIEYPKVHDVSDVLISSKDRFPHWFEKEIPNLAKFSRSLAEKRSAAMYGVEVSGKPPGEIFNDPLEAHQVLNEARKLHRLCSKLISKEKKELPKSRLSKHVSVDEALDFPQKQDNPKLGISQEPGR